MYSFSRRDMMRLAVTLPLGSRLAGASMWMGGAADWSKDVIDGVMHRKPEPAMLGKWGYAISLYLYGQYLVYQRTHDKKYLDYIQGWVDACVDANGVISAKLNALDDMLGGNLLIVLYKETQAQKV